MLLRTTRVLAVASGLGSASPSARAQALPQPPPGIQTITANGIQFSLVGSSGNRPVNATEAPQLYPPYSYPASPVGAVAYQYGISRTEITASQWVEFVRAYSPYFDNAADPYDPRFVSDLINVNYTGSGQVPTYSVPPQTANKPVAVGWNYTAMYCNWLTNNKGTSLSSFMTGAYDLTSVTVAANGHWTSLPTRLPTATYWMASVDEWDKAAYYDPNRYGHGQEGYWTYPNGSNTPLIPGWPEQGGQTDAGIPYPGPNDDYRINDVASYTTVQSPWGLFDLSGGENEWTDTSDAFLDSAVEKGTQRYEPSEVVAQFDRIEWEESGYALLNSAGIRLATSIPVQFRADFNHDGALNVLDIFDFLSAWFAGSPFADFNGMNGINENDIFDFLVAWFSGT